MMNRLTLIARLGLFAFICLALSAGNPFSCSKDDVEEATSNINDDGIAVEDRDLCAAVDAASTQDFLDNNNTADFDQLDNDQDVFLLDLTDDGFNVVEIVSARVDFDYEDGDVDPGDLGGFYARWKMIILPYDADIIVDLEAANSASQQNSLLKNLRAEASAIEAQLPGPFLENGCEWGDTDEIGTQTLTYYNYWIYDWDTDVNVDKIVVVVYEGDDGLNDDLIGWAVINKTDTDPIVIQETGKYRIEFTANTDVSL